MGVKDITEKTLEAYNDVFADIVNVLLFNGKQVIMEDELEEDAPGSHYKASCFAKRCCYPSNSFAVPFSSITTVFR